MRHPFFKKEPYTEREAWMWLIEQAAWKAHRHRAGSYVFNLERGQLSASVRFMGEAWQWSKSKVQRFLVRLKTDTMVELSHGTGQLTGNTVVTICNYNSYQITPLSHNIVGGTEDGTANGTAAGQQRDKL